jgi:RNA polymerase sigma-70 factor, ECF subfamily
MPMVASTTESVLVQDFRDPQRRGEVLQHCANYLTLLARSQFDRRIQARTSVSDVVQDTLLEAHRDFAQFRGRRTGEFLGWLRQVLLNNLAAAVDGHVGAAKRDVRRERSLEKVGTSIEGSADRFAEFLMASGNSPSASAMHHEELLILADVLSQLPGDYYDVIAGRHIEGLPFRELAERMNRSEGAVRMLWFRAMDRLRTILAEKGVL